MPRRLSGKIAVSIRLATTSNKWSSTKGGNQSIVHFRTLKLKPEKVHFGESVIATAGVTVDRKVEGETLSSLQIWRILRIFGYEMNVKIGCYYGYGSCVRKLSDIVNDNKVMCDWYRNAMNGNCKNFTGDILAGNFTTNSLRTTFPEVKGIAAALLSGLYRVRWEWMLKKDEPAFACFTADFLVE